MSEGRKLRRTALKQILERAGGAKGVDAAFPNIAASADLHPPLQPLRREEGTKGLPEACASPLPIPVLQILPHLQVGDLPFHTGLNTNISSTCCLTHCCTSLVGPCPGQVC